MRRSIATVVLVAVVGVVLAGSMGSTAGAGGGSGLTGDREFYRPGEPVHLTAEVYKADRDWFGPYTVYLRPVDPAAPAPDAYDPAGTHAEDVAVGRLVVTRTGDRHVRAEVTFVLPKLVDGMYSVDYCGADCSKRLGDLYDSLLYVGTAPYVWPPPRPEALATTVAPTTSVVTTAAPTTPPTTAADRRDAVDDPATLLAASAPRDGAASGGPAVVAVIAVIAIAALVILLVVRRRPGRPPRRSITTSPPIGDRAGPDDPVFDVALDGDASADATIGSGR